VSSPTIWAFLSNLYTEDDEDEDEDDKDEDRDGDEDGDEDEDKDKDSAAVVPIPAPSTTSNKSKATVVPIPAPSPVATTATTTTTNNAPPLVTAPTAPTAPSTATSRSLPPAKRNIKPAARYLARAHEFFVRLGNKPFEREDSNINYDEAERLREIYQTSDGLTMVASAFQLLEEEGVPEDPDDHILNLHHLLVARHGSHITLDALAVAAATPANAGNDRTSNNPAHPTAYNSAAPITTDSATPAATNSAAPTTTDPAAPTATTAATTKAKTRGKGKGKGKGKNTNTPAATTTNTNAAPPTTTTAATTNATNAATTNAAAPSATPTSTTPTNATPAPPTINTVTSATAPTATTATTTATTTKPSAAKPSAKYVAMTKSFIESLGPPYKSKDPQLPSYELESLCESILQPDELDQMALVVERLVEKGEIDKVTSPAGRYEIIRGVYPELQQLVDAKHGCGTDPFTVMSTFATGATTTTPDNSDDNDIQLVANPAPPTIATRSKNNNKKPAKQPAQQPDGPASGGRQLRGNKRKAADVAGEGEAVKVAGSNKRRR
jgi:hypothetical protein